MKRARQMNGSRAARANAAEVWAEIEEQFVPSLQPWPVERLIYFYLVRQTRLEGRRSVLISATQLARAVAFAPVTVRVALRRLAGKGAIRVVERGRKGQRIEVRRPREIPGCARPARDTREMDIESADFFSHRRLRAAIYGREKQRCFYCGRGLHYGNRTLDHVRARAEGGENGYRNVVACCVECNSEKGDMSGKELLQVLVRRGVLTRKEFGGRMAKLLALQQGKLRPDTSASGAASCAARKRE